MIYATNGNELSIAYSVDGQAIQNAYDVDGEEVFHSHGTPDYNNYTITTLRNAVSGSLQGFDIYNGIIAQFKASNGLVLLDANSDAVLTDTLTCSGGHGNNVNFSNEFYSQDDEFPLLYIADAYKYVRIVRISRTETSLIKTLYMPTTIEGGGYKLAYGLDGNIMYSFGYSQENYSSDAGGSNYLILSKWDLSNLSDNGDGTFTPELIEQHTRPFFVCTQGSQYKNGYFWVTSGLGGTISHIYAINPSNANIAYTINLTTAEVEGCAWMGDDLIALCGPYNKITFGTN